MEFSETRTLGCTIAELQPMRTNVVGLALLVGLSIVRVD